MIKQKYLFTWFSFHYNNSDYIKTLRINTLQIMHKNLSLVLEPEIAFDEDNFKNYIHKLLQFPADENTYIRPLKRSIDARGRQVKVNVEAEVFINEVPSPIISFKKNYSNVSNAKKAIIIGAGPAGLFAALRLIELGIKPILLERGKDVRARRRDLAAINKDHIVNPESNYCFGEVVLALILTVNYTPEAKKEVILEGFKKF
jgi:uncharacterized protein